MCAYTKKDCTGDGFCCDVTKSTCDYLAEKKLDNPGCKELTDTGNQSSAQCVSHITDKASPYHDSAQCPLVQYWSNHSDFPIDCRCAGKLENPCKRPYTLEPKISYGEGPRMRDLASTVQAWNGVLIGGEWFVAIGWSTSTKKYQTMVFAIDIKTGDRRVISGSYLDSKTGRVDVGSGHSVKGEALPFLVDVKLGKDGQIYAMGSDTLNNVEITRVDPKTGARTLVWRRQSLDDGGAADFAYGQCFSGIPSKEYDSGFSPLQYAERAFALGEDGSFFLGWKGDGVGVVRVSADGKTCSIVSRWASNNKTKPLDDVGTGVTPQYGTISGMLHRKGLIYV